MSAAKKSKKDSTLSNDSSVALLDALVRSSPLESTSEVESQSSQDVVMLGMAHLYLYYIIN
jgi:hypothetical protein